MQETGGEHMQLFLQRPRTHMARSPSTTRVSGHYSGEQAKRNPVRILNSSQHNSGWRVIESGASLTMTDIGRGIMPAVARVELRV